MKILLTGATGQVGGPLTRQLLELGCPVRLATPRLEASRETLSPLVEQVRLDFAEPATFTPALAGMERVFLLRPPQISDVRRYLFPFVDAARDAGVKQVVFLSLLGADKNPVAPHRKVEEYLSRQPMAFTFLRPGFFMQNLSGVHREDIVRHSRIYLPAGRGRTSFIDATDIAAVAALTLTASGHENRAYTLTGGEALDYYQVAETFSRVLGRPVTYQPASLPGFALHMRRQGHAWPYVLVMTGIYLTTRFGLASTITGDLPRLLGRPPIRFAEFVRRCAGEWKQAAC